MSGLTVVHLSATFAHGASFIVKPSGIRDLIMKTFMPVVLALIPLVAVASAVIAVP